MSQPPFGEYLVLVIRKYLADNGLQYLRQLNANMIQELSQRAFDKYTATEKAERAKHRAAVMPKKERDALCDALAEACGANPREMTTTAARACATAVAEIIKASPDVTIADMQARVSRYKVLYRDAAVTPRAVCSHWAECGSGKPAAPKTSAGQNTQAIPEPAGWNDILPPDDDDYRFITAPWASLMPFYQKRIAATVARLQLQSVSK